MSSFAPDNEVPLPDAERRLVSFAPGETFRGAVFAALEPSLITASPNGAPRAVRCAPRH